MTTIREALDTYPLAHLLRPGRRGQMDLRPSLALHIAAAVDDVPAKSDNTIGELVDLLVDLRDEWAQLADMLPVGTERVMTLRECVIQLTRLLDGEV